MAAERVVTMVELVDTTEEVAAAIMAEAASAVPEAPEASVALGVSAALGVSVEEEDITEDSVEVVPVATTVEEAVEEVATAAVVAVEAMAEADTMLLHRTSSATMSRMSTETVRAARKAETAAAL